MQDIGAEERGGAVAVRPAIGCVMLFRSSAFISMVQRSVWYGVEAE